LTNQVNDAETADSAWKSLYRVGGAAALIMAVFIPIQMIIFMVWPPPSTVIGWFTLFQNNRLLGLLDMDLLLIVDQVLMVLVLLALYVALRRPSQSFMAVALTLGLVGIAVYFASTTAFEMLSLSDQYAAATTEAERSMFLAAGQAMLTTFNVGAFQVSYLIVSAAWLMISVVMLRSSVFGRVAACSGILTGATAIGAVALEHTPVIGDLFVLLISVYFAAIVFLVIWVVLIARRLFQLG